MSCSQTAICHRVTHSGFIGGRGKGGGEGGGEVGGGGSEIERVGEGTD